MPGQPLPQGLHTINEIEDAKWLQPKVRMVKHIRSRFTTQWARIQTDLKEWMERAMDEDDEEAYSIALKWFLCSHVIMLRAPEKSRGRQRRTRDTMGARFEAWEKGQFRQLIEWTGIAMERTQHSTHRGQDKQARIMALIRCGELGKARRLAVSKGLADMTLPGVQEQLNSKHPERREEMPTRLDMTGLPWVQVPLRQRYRKLSASAGVGPDGYRNSYLIPLAHVHSDPKAARAINAHEEIAFWFLNAVMPDWAYEWMAQTRMIAIIKAERDGGTPDVRPIAMGGCRQRAWLAQATQGVSAAAAMEMAPEQVAIGVPNGLEKLIMACKLHLQWQPEHVIIKMDFKNAFNEASRTETLRCIMRSPSMRSLGPIFWAMHKPKAVVMGIQARSEEGVRQGSPLAAAAFCRGIHEDIVQANADLRPHKGKVIFDMDDGYVMGPMQQAFQVAQQLAQRLRHRYNVIVQPQKCKAFCQNEDELEKFLDENDNGYAQGTNEKGSLGIMVAGIPMGTEEFVDEQLEGKVDKVCESIKTIVKELRHLSHQALIAIITYCCAPMMNYEMRNIAPWTMEKHLQRVDRKLRQAMEMATGVAFEGPLMPPYADQRLKLPKRRRGGALRRTTETAWAAYGGGLLASIRTMVNHTKTDRNRTIVTSIGTHHDMGMWLLGAPVKERQRTPPFKELIQRGRTSGTELQRIWEHFQSKRLADDDEWLAKEVQKAGTNADNEYVFGDGMQKMMTEVLDKHNYKTLDDAIQQLPVDNRYYKLWHSLDEYSTQFVASIPFDERTAISNDHLKLAYEQYYGAECTRIHDLQLVGKDIRAPTKNKSHKCDKYGDRLASTATSRLTIRRHDGIKFTLSALMQAAKMDFVCEPVNLFAAHIRQADGDEHATRQGLRPDFIITKNSGTILVDVKTFAMCTSRYKDRAKYSAVNVRQKAVPGEYERKARNADKEAYIRANPGTNGPGDTYEGPVLRQLRGYRGVNGLVVGAFGEMSSNVNELVSTIAHERAKSWKTMGATDYDDAVAKAARLAKLYLGIEAVRGYAHLKAERIREESGRRGGARSSAEGLKQKSNAFRRDQRDYFVDACNGVYGQIGHTPLFDYKQWPSLYPRVGSRHRLS